VKFVFDLAILRELGFTQGEITRLVNGNDRLSGALRLALRFMDET
jgi:hypothetical protein